MSPSATIEVLKQRSVLINKIRQFFAERNVLEVDTQLISHASVTDPHVMGIPALYKEIGASQEKRVYLQTSPEYAMKRLLACGIGSIYQICKAFRQGEVGKNHNPEFTMLEWYRIGFDHHALMDEMDLLLQTILNVKPAERCSYAQLFQRFLQINPHTATLLEFQQCAEQNNLKFSLEKTDKNFWLDLLLTHCIEPHIGKEKPVFIYDFPMTQAALAKIRFEEDPPVASRFEVYFKGIELANGFHELQNAKEQRKRFEKDLLQRSQMGIDPVPIDENFLAALSQGLPDCAGVALGVDRLMMLTLNKNTISEVISFSFERA